MVPAMSRLTTIFAILSALAIASTGCENTAASGGGGDNGDLAKRVKKLEDEAAKNAEAMQFLREQYKRIKAQQEEQAAQEPAEDAVFAVDITGNQIDGPKSGAYVTIIEAWDFA
jgi:hypothetical protein